MHHGHMSPCILSHSLLAAPAGLQGSPAAGWCGAGSGKLLGLWDGWAACVPLSTWCLRQRKLWAVRYMWRAAQCLAGCMRAAVRLVPATG